MLPLKVAWKAYVRAPSVSGRRARRPLLPWDSVVVTHIGTDAIDSVRMRSQQQRAVHAEFFIFESWPGRAALGKVRATSGICVVHPSNISD